MLKAFAYVAMLRCSVCDTYGDVSCCCYAPLQSLENELDKQIPEDIQQRLRDHWQENQSVRVVCEQLLGTFTVEAGSLVIRADDGSGNLGHPLHPRTFEVEAGRVSSKNWKISVRLLDFTVNGKPGAPLVKLGHFMIVNGIKDAPSANVTKQDMLLGPA
jgi:hypothetical protein